MSRGAEEHSKDLETDNKVHTLYHDGTERNRWHSERSEYRTDEQDAIERGAERMTDRTPDTPGRSGERAADESDEETISSESFEEVVTEARDTVDPEAVEASVSTIAETVEDVIDEVGNRAGENIETPAFEFEETVQQTIYVRPSSLRELEDLEALVDARLRTDHDVRNLTGSEFYDAVVRVAANHEEELLAAVLSERTGGE